MIDLSKVQYDSSANSFKNDSLLYIGSIVFPTTIAVGTFVTITQDFTVPEQPVFSHLYAFFKEFSDASASFNGYSGDRGAQWYKISVNAKVGLIVTAPAANAGPLEALIYPVINGSTITVTGIVNNPYPSNITLNPVTVPFGYIEYTLTN